MRAPHRVAFVALLAGLAGLSSASTPEFTLPARSGGTLSLEELKGQVVMIVGANQPLISLFCSDSNSKTQRQFDCSFITFCVKNCVAYEHLILCCVIKILEVISQCRISCS